MSPSIREPSDEQQIDLGTGVDRRLLMAAAGLGLVALTAIVLMCLFAGTQAAPKEDPALAQRTASPPRENVYSLPAITKVRTQPRESPPQEIPVEVAKAPAVAELPKQQPKPEIVAAKPVHAPSVPVVKPQPAPPDTVEVVETPQPPRFRRLHPYSEEELRRRLAEESREVDIEIEKGTTKKLLDEPKKGTQAQSGEDRLIEAKGVSKSKPKTPAILELVAQRSDLKGLPMRSLSDCQTAEKEAKTIEEMSREARRAIAKTRGRGSDRGSTETFELEFQLMEYIRDNKWDEEVGVRMLMQMFQADSFGVRRQMVKTLAKNDAKSAGAALARMAVFDLNPDVREAAVEALKDRPRAEFRPALLEALRYPWPPVADHAAEALVALKDRKAAFDLARLLDEPDPLAPTQDKENKWVVPELVRVNHLGNCVLCHAPSSDKKDPVRGLVPERGEAIPVVYYESKSGSFVRADVTYVKQDFSLLQTVPEPNKWPSVQRFDYLVRMRELSATEVSRLPLPKYREAEDPAIYPQRAAVLWALRELTGRNKGVRSADWEECLKDARTTADPKSDD